MAQEAKQALIFVLFVTLIKWMTVACVVMSIGWRN